MTNHRPTESESEEFKKETVLVSNVRMSIVSIRVEQVVKAKGYEFLI